MHTYIFTIKYRDSYGAIIAISGLTWHSCTLIVQVYEKHNT